MDASALWSYPGTWAGLGIMVVLVGGLVVFALALRRTLRAPPIDEPSTAVPPSTDSENDKKP